jgi:hypothetical protein
MAPPIVFVSYSHDSPEHKSWVLEFSARLRSNGIDAILDQWDLGPGGDLPHFMEQSIARSSRVLMICTERYVEKANAGLGGVGFEKMVVTADLLQQIGLSKVIPIVRQTGVHKLPTFLRSKLYIDLSSTDKFETGFDQLLRELLNAPLFQKPPLGTTPTLTPQEKPRSTLPDPLTQFMTALSSAYERSSTTGAVSTDVVMKTMGVSKLLFDHAFDQAERLKLVSAAGSRTLIWVEPAGRERMLEIQASHNSAA